MKKVLWLGGILFILTLLFFLFLPKKYTFELSNEELEEKAEENFPKIYGKEVTLDIKNLTKSTGFGELFSEISDVLSIPKIPTKTILLKTELEVPKIYLTENTVKLSFAIQSRVSKDFLFSFVKEDYLPITYKYQEVSEYIREKFSFKYTLAVDAKISNSGKNTWIIQSDGNEYLLVNAENKIHVFQTKKGGKFVLGVSAKAYAKVSGKIRYKQKTQTLYFHDLIVHDLKIDKLPNNFLPIQFLRKIIQEQINIILKNQEIAFCNLREIAERKGNIFLKVVSTFFLKNVKIEKDKLIIDLSLKK